MLVSSWLLAAAADTSAIGSLLNAGPRFGPAVNALLPGFSIAEMLSNPSSIAGLLQTMGFSEECLSAIVNFAISCLAELQFLPMLIIDPTVGQVILEYSELLYLNAAASAVAED